MIKGISASLSNFFTLKLSVTWWPFGWLRLHRRRFHRVFWHTRALHGLLRNCLVLSWLFFVLLVMLLIQHSFPAFSDGVAVLVPIKGFQPTAGVSQNWMMSPETCHFCGPRANPNLDSCPYYIGCDTEETWKRWTIREKWNTRGLNPDAAPFQVCTYFSEMVLCRTMAWDLEPTTNQNFKLRRKAAVNAHKTLELIHLFQFH